MKLSTASDHNPSLAELQSLEARFLSVNAAARHGTYFEALGDPTETAAYLADFNAVIAERATKVHIAAVLDQLDIKAVETKAPGLRLIIGGKALVANPALKAMPQPPQPK